MATSRGRGLARRLDPEPRRSMAWTVTSPGAASAAARRSSCCAVLRVPWRRITGVGPDPVTRQPMASPSGRASSPAGSPARSARTASRRTFPPVVRGSASSLVNATGTLNPASDARAWAARASSTGSRSRCPEDDRGDGDLAPRLVRAPDDGRGRDRRVRLEHRLDLARVDVLAAAHDPVRAPVHDHQPAVLVEAAEVAGPERLVGMRPVRRPGSRRTATAPRRRSPPPRPGPARRS